MQSEDMAAIREYFVRANPQTEKAGKIKHGFIGWYDQLSWWDRSMSEDAYTEAKTRRNAYNLANAKTAEESEQVKFVIATGMTTKEMQGKVIPVTSAEKKRIQKQGTSVGRVTIRQGDIGPAVLDWQRHLGVTQDSKFGPLLRTATIAYQKKNGLTPDGVVGRETWATVPGNAPVTSTADRPMPDAAQMKAAEKSAPMPVLPGQKVNAVVKSRKVKKQADEEKKVEQGASSVANKTPLPKKEIPKDEPKKDGPKKEEPKTLTAGIGSGIVDGFMKLPTVGKGLVVAGIGLGTALLTGVSLNEKR